MKKGRKWMIALIALLVLCSVCLACSKKTTTPDALDYGDPDLSEENAAGLENAARYVTRYKNGGINIGDVMPYYHDGVYSFFYLAETSNHPVYRVDTTDFVHYEDRGEALSPGASNAQDAMIGTGSITEAGGDYYFFYTGFKKDNPEAVMLAKSSGSIDHFEKVPDFMFSAASVADCDLDGWDFRDPEALYDKDNERFVLYISARKNNQPVIAKFTVPLDLSAVRYDGVVYSDTRFGANVLECCDLFRMGDKWYLTYSVQDVSNGGNDGEHSTEAAVGSQGKVFYAVSDSIDGPFTAVADDALDSHAFYAAKTVQDGANTYLAGWIRQKNSNVGWQYIWGGNLQVHQLVQNPDGTLSVALPQSIRNYYSVERKLENTLDAYNGYDMIAESKDYHVVSREYSSYLLHATVSFDAETTEFGFALGVSSNTANIMEVSFVPFADKLRSAMSGQQELCSKYIRLTPGQEYDVTLLVEGSAVTLYVNDSVAFTSRMRNLGNKKLAVFAKGGSVTMKDFHLYTPSGYADTLSSGYGNLTVTENGREQKGRVNRIVVSPSAPAKVEYTATEDNFLRATAAVRSDKAARVTAKLDGKILGEYVAEASEVLQVSIETFAPKGSRLTLEYTSDEETALLTNVSVETDKRPFEASVKAELVSDRTATYTAGESGVFEYVATLYYGGDMNGNPAFEAGGAYCAITDKARLVTLRGAVQLNAGETLSAALRYENFTPQVGAHKVVLQIREGTDTFAAGLGTYTRPLPKSCNVVTETVPTYAGVEWSGLREMSVEMNGDLFGEQGKNGFVYAYGKAGDELLPMTEFNTNGEIWEYKHKAPEANDALEIKADYMKQGGGYVTAVVWVAPADGYIDFVADYTRNSGFVQVQVLRNHTLLYDKFLHDGDTRADAALTGLEVKSGDSVALVVRAAGRTLGESDGNYHLRVGKGNSTVPFDPNAPPIADFAADYNADRQGDYGWKYMDVGYTWEGGERPTTVAELLKTDFGWGNSGKGIDDKGVIFGGATVAWKNETDSELTVGIGGRVRAVRPDGTVWVRVWMIRADGTQENIASGGFTDTFVLPDKGYRMQPGDMLAVMFFDNNGDGCTLDMTVRSHDDVAFSDVAIRALIAQAKAIDNSDNRYTADSFAALTEEIAAAERFADSMAADGKTYTEIAERCAALKAAVAGLKLDTSAARNELSGKITAAAKFEGKTLIGDTAAFEAALTAAKAVAAKQDATSDELTEAAGNLAAAMQKISIQVIDFAADFGGAQGDKGLVYLKVSPTNWDNYGAGGTITEMTFQNGRYILDNAIVSPDLWVGSGAAIGYRNYTATAHTYQLSGKVTYLGGGEACVAYVIMRADGTFDHFSNWNVYSAEHTIAKSVSLGAGDTLLIVLRDVGGKATDSKLELRVGCNDDLTVSTGILQTLVNRAAEIKEADYTAESYAALTEAVTAAQTVLNQTAPTAGETYRAETALKHAIASLVAVNAVETTTQADLLNGSGLWKAVRIGITWDPSRLVKADMVDYETKESGLGLGAGETVVQGDNAILLSSDNSGVALLFTVQTAGTYRFTSTYTGANKTNCRIFVGSGNELAEREWIGQDETVEKTLTLNQGDVIAIHFESFSDGKTLTAASFAFTLALAA